MVQKLPQAEIRKKIDANQMRVRDWTDFHARISKMSDTTWIFRGVSAPHHYPQPSIGRECQYGPYKLAQEERLLRAFKDRAVALMPAVGHEALRAVAAIYVGRFGDHTRRKTLIASYSSVSQYIQTAIYFSSRGLPTPERNTAKASWGSHSPLNALLTAAMVSS
jgi:hypothetical protein